MPGPAFATGDSVALHPIEDDDHEFLQYGRNHPRTRKPLTETTIRSVDEVPETLGDYHFLVCADGPEATTGYGPEDGPEPVGVVAFAYTRGTDSGSLMYWVAPEHQGNGYASEAVELFLAYAFREVGFHKATARVLVTNEPSVALLESLGFEREGRFREEQFVDGEWTDAYQYGVLADDWLAD
ncbi:MAG: GNAT family N-acetyltransferase [Halobacterium sp.]